MNNLHSATPSARDAGDTDVHTDNTFAPYVVLFWGEFEECVQGGLGVPAWKVSVGQPVWKHTSTGDRNIHSNIQAAILLVFKIDVS